MYPTRHFACTSTGVHEGGISTPFIVHWPNRVTDNGALREQPGQLTDVMATCLDVAGADYPETYNEHDILPLEGTSLTPIFDNQGQRQRISHLGTRRQWRNSQRQVETGQALPGRLGAIRY